MRTTRRWTSAWTRAALFVAVAAAWVMLAPTSFGGQTSYVIVAGASAYPRIIDFERFRDAVLVHLKSQSA